MKYCERLMLTFLVFALLCLLFPEKTCACEKICAYLDPGTGILILQVLMGILVGGLVAIKVFYNNIKSFFKNLSSKWKKRTEAKN